MLNKAQKLNTKQVGAVFDRGKFVHSPMMTLKWTAGNKETKCAVAVGVKVAKSAVKRNRVKRQIRAMLYEVQAQISPGTHYVVIAGPGMLEREFADVQTDLMALLKKAQLI